MADTFLGILEPELGWLQILEQEGIVYKVLSQIPEKYSSPIIINRELNEEEVIHTHNLLDSGVGIITDFQNLSMLISNIRYKTSRISYIYGESELFYNISIIDLKLKGNRLATHSRKSENEKQKVDSIFEAEYGKGYIIALPFDVNQAILDTRSELKPFYFPHRKFPYELVAVINKGAVRKLVVNCLKKLYQKMHLPYVHLWYYPNTFQSAFCFRVDTDFAPEIALRTTLNLSQTKDIDFTYFINTGQMPNIQHPMFRDIQIHCFRHQVYKDYPKNFENIKTAKSILVKNGIKPIGFVSPFGKWNKNLQYAMESNGIKYSSEFSLDYDNLPFFPIVNNKKSSVLQIPVHPICIGRLLQAGLSEEQCKKYYEDYLVAQYLANEPIFIYDHPHRIHQFPELFSAVLDKVKGLSNLWITTMTEFYHWWIKRLNIYNSFEWQMQNTTLKIETADHWDNVFLHIITPDAKESFIPIKNGHYELTNLQYTPISQVRQQKDFSKIIYTRSAQAKIQTIFYELIKWISNLGK
ncbi:MAG: hypothetical protein ABIK61_04685 [candidate division WOR-3 bacterium]